jgi:hypothetical protein
MSFAWVRLPAPRYWFRDPGFVVNIVRLTRARNSLTPSRVYSYDGVDWRICSNVLQLTWASYESLSSVR